MKPTHFVPRILVLFLSVAIGLPPVLMGLGLGESNPAFALRTLNGDESQKVKGGLEEALLPDWANTRAAGLEEPSQRTIIAQLLALKQATTPEQTEAAAKELASRFEEWFIQPLMEAFPSHSSSVQAAEPAAESLFERTQFLQEQILKEIALVGKIQETYQWVDFLFQESNRRNLKLIDLPEFQPLLQRWTSLNRQFLSREGVMDEAKIVSLKEDLDRAIRTTPLRKLGRPNLQHAKKTLSGNAIAMYAAQNRLEDAHSILVNYVSKSETGLEEKARLKPEEVHIVVAEDEDGIRKLLTGIVNSAAKDVGIGPQQIHSAADVAEAVRLIQEHRPQLVLTDLNMPDPSGAGRLGFDVARKAKEMDPLAQVILVANPRDREQEKAKNEALDNGTLDGFIEKPKVFGPVTAAIKEFLENRVETGLEEREVGGIGQTPAAPQSTLFILLDPTAFEGGTGEERKRLTTILATLQGKLFPAGRFIVLGKNSTPEEMADLVVPILEASDASVMAVGLEKDPQIAAFRKMLDPLNGSIPFRLVSPASFLAQLESNLGSPDAVIEKVLQQLFQSVGLEETAA